MENKLSLIEDAARSNGWTIVGLVKDRYKSGRHPGGVVACVRYVAPFPDRRCCTNRYYIDESENVVFISGVYDLTREEALEDLTVRSEIVCRHDKLVTVDG